MSEAPAICTHCGDVLKPDQAECWTEGDQRAQAAMEVHRGLCCGCFDLRMGKPIDEVNDLRVRSGKSPVRAFDDPAN